MDSLNCILLLVTCIMTATYSAWNTGIEERFFYGILFDSLMGLQFMLNAGLIIQQISYEASLKFKRARFRCRLKKAREAKLALRRR